MERLSGGYINEVWRINGYVTKTYQENEVIKTPSTVRFDREIEALIRFGGTLAPRLVGVNQEDRILSCEFVSGENMRTVLPVMTDGAQDVLFEGMGQKIKELHAITTGIQIDSYSYDVRQKAFGDYLSFFKSGIPKYFGLDDDIVLRKMVRSVLPAVSKAIHKQEALSYIHGDYWTNNIIGNPETGEIERIIDWEYFTVGMPQDDLAYTYLWDLRNHPDRLEAFKRGYGLVEAVPEFSYLKILDLVGAATMEQVQRENGSGFITDHVLLLRENGILGN